VYLTIITVYSRYTVLDALQAVHVAVCSMLAAPWRMVFENLTFPLLGKTYPQIRKQIYYGHDSSPSRDRRLR